MTTTHTTSSEIWGNEELEVVTLLRKKCWSANLLQLKYFSLKGPLILWNLWQDKSFVQYSFQGLEWNTYTHNSKNILQGVYITLIMPNNNNQDKTSYMASLERKNRFPESKTRVSSYTENIGVKDASRQHNVSKFGKKPV